MCAVLCAAAAGVTLHTFRLLLALKHKGPKNVRVFSDSMAVWNAARQSLCTQGRGGRGGLVCVYVCGCLFVLVYL